MTLKWDSPFIDVQLHVELPFWLMMPDCDTTVTHMGCALKCTVIGDAIEIQSGAMYLPSRANVEHFEKVRDLPAELHQDWNRTSFL